MKIRSFLLLAGLAAAIAPTAHAEDQCDSPIYIFSKTRAQTDVDDPTNPGTPVGRTAPTAVSSTVGCTIRDDVQPGPEAAYLYDTDVIYPGSNRLSVRLLENGTDPSLVSLATITIGDEVRNLTMRAGTSTTGAAPWLDSADVTIDPAATVGPLSVTADICLDVFGTPEDLSDDLCFTRTYNSIASHELPS